MTKIKFDEKICKTLNEREQIAATYLKTTYGYNSFAKIGVLDFLAQKLDKYGMPIAGTMVFVEVKDRHSDSTRPNQNFIIHTFQTNNIKVLTITVDMTVSLEVVNVDKHLESDVNTDAENQDKLRCAECNHTKGKYHDEYRRDRCQWHFKDEYGNSATCSCQKFVLKNEDRLNGWIVDESRTPTDPLDKRVYYIRVKK